MKTLKKLTIALILILGILSVNAQQTPMYTHYMYNTLLINPAYAGSRDALTITALNRSQWVDFGGAPITQTLSIHSPIKSEHIGLGLSILNDKIGPTNNTSAFIDFSFIMNLSEKSKLALGLSGGANIFRANLNSLELIEQNDPVFINNIDNLIAPNFGFGAYYSRERFYAGVSVPNLLENSYSEMSQSNGNVLIGKEQRHYFFIAGAIFNLSPNLAFKPTTLVKVTAAAPIQADITASFIIMKRLMLGAMFRTGDATGALVGLDISDQFHLGYSFDWSYGLKTGKYNYGSHELVLRYDFIFNSKKQIHSPRYF
jgi:type IX secretion system PorP/SprF family membrane protein